MGTGGAVQPEVERVTNWHAPLGNQNIKGRNPQGKINNVKFWMVFFGFLSSTVCYM
jgi:hypothetical protein